MIRHAFRGWMIVGAALVAGCRTGGPPPPPPTTMVDVNVVARQLGMDVTHSGSMLVLSGPRGTVVFNPQLRGILIGGKVCFRGTQVFVRGDQVTLPAGFEAECSKQFGTTKPTTTGPINRPPVSTGRYRVVIDPGHGGRDPGAIGANGGREKTVNLGVGLAAASKLRAAGVDVTMTRSGDEFIELNDRAAIGNRLGADAFVSIHADSSSDRSVRGYTVFVVHTKYSDAERAAEIASECNVGATGSRREEAVRSILAANHARSQRLASLIRAEMGKVSNSPDRGIQLGALRVLNRSLCPAVLVEIGFMSNAGEERLLFQSNYEDEIGSALAAGVLAYLQGR